MTKGKELFIKNLFMFIKEKQRSLGGKERGGNFIKKSDPI